MSMYPLPAKVTANGNGHRHNNGGVQTPPKINWRVVGMSEEDTSPAQTAAPNQGVNESYDAEFEKLIEQMLVRLGEDTQRDGLIKTPLRVAKAMDFLTSGYDASLQEVVNGAIFEEDVEDMVLVKDIEFYSLCEHHMLPFYGKVHIAYIPNGKIIGLSKLARIADVFARRLQVQERLTSQIADALVELLDPKGVAVATDAAHFCMMMRGVQKQGSTTITTAFRGEFKTDVTERQQFLSMIGAS